MERIESLYYGTKGKCYMSFSGGKDSTVILALIKMCEEILTIPKNSIPAVFCNTGIELGATIDFVNWVKDHWYRNVQIIRPQVSFTWVLENRGKPMFSKVRSELLNRWAKNRTNSTIMNLIDQEGFRRKTRLADKNMHALHDNFDIRVSSLCCKYLKKEPFRQFNLANGVKGYIVGERSAEGGIREIDAAKRVQSGGKLCTKTKGEYVVKLPIIDWTDQDIEEFILRYDVPMSKAYTEQGYDRTGCFCCPFSLKLADNLKKLYEYEPNRYKASMHWLKDVYIAQNVILPFDLEYEKERIEKWNSAYEQMRYEMIMKHRPEKEDSFCQQTMNL